MTVVPDRLTATHVAATLLTALAECPDGTREGLAYAGLMGVCDLQTFQYVLAFLETAGHIKRGPSHKLDITADGKLLAAVIERRLAAARAAKGGV